jgi:hypothetical protein
MILYSINFYCGLLLLEEKYVTFNRKLNCSLNIINYVATHYFNKQLKK